MQDEHERFMRESIELAQSAVAKGNQPFGALLVRDGEVVLRAENSTITGKDFTNHAELMLARMAAAQFDAAYLNGCTLYTSTEPCAMCAGAIYWAGIGRVVYGCSAARLYEIVGVGGLNVPCRDVLLRGVRSVEVIGPVSEADAEKVHLGDWPKRMNN
jgi:tRNA(Arg) A34 adenosine deaminase TadA